MAGMVWWKLGLLGGVAALSLALTGCVASSADVDDQADTVGVAEDSVVDAPSAPKFDTAPGTPGDGDTEPPPQPWDTRAGQTQEPPPQPWDPSRKVSDPSSPKK